MDETIQELPGRAVPSNRRRDTLVTFQHPPHGDSIGPAIDRSPKWTEPAMRNYANDMTAFKSTPMYGIHP